MFEFDKVYYRVKPTEELLLLKPFSTIWKRDKIKDKTKALKEIGFVWFYCNIKSPHLDMEEPLKTEEIIKDVELAKTWKPDKAVKEAIKYCDDHKTILERLYEGSVIAASEVDKVCRDRTTIQGADDKLVAAEKVARIVEKMPKLMENLKKSEKEVLKEKDEKAGKSKGSQTYNTYEDMESLDGHI